MELWHMQNTHHPILLAFFIHFTKRGREREKEWIIAATNMNQIHVVRLYGKWHSINAQHIQHLICSSWNWVKSQKRWDAGEVKTNDNCFYIYIFFLHSKWYTHSFAISCFFFPSIFQITKMSKTKTAFAFELHFWRLSSIQ